MPPNPPSRPPDVINVVRRLTYSGDSLLETATDMASGSDDEVVGLPDIIGLVLEYAAEDINNATLNFEVIAVWHDEHGNETDAVVYDNNGWPIEWTVTNQ